MLQKQIISFIYKWDKHEAYADKSYTDDYKAFILNNQGFNILHSILYTQLGRDEGLINMYSDKYSECYYQWLWVILNNCELKGTGKSDFLTKWIVIVDPESKAFSKDFQKTLTSNVVSSIHSFTLPMKALGSILEPGQQGRGITMKEVHLKAALGCLKSCPIYCIVHYIYIYMPHFIWLSTFCV